MRGSQGLGEAGPAEFPWVTENVGEPEVFLVAQHRECSESHRKRCFKSLKVLAHSANPSSLESEASGPRKV